ncbi:hypothetical protein HYALB_00013260 [Hymenoscyphus albidus]|uniref:Uncharacterized protein n=1 Tax=Hymenoscyphus albidus TaxID=595503 RepID=A0A9N9LS39_9HELO|nr:hypothetical protein HYALB_00013260 [Hymenoscyphus albidus]
MQRLTLLIPIISLLLSLISASACVAGGLATQVTQVGACCKSLAGTWYQFYPNQAICVVADDRLWAYKSCVGRVGYSDLDTKCIPGNGEGLSTAIGTPTAFTTGRETITAAA